MRVEPETLEGPPVEIPAWASPDPAAWETARASLPGPSGPSWPGPGEYLADVALRFQYWLSTWIEGAFSSWLGSELLWGSLAWIVAGGIAAGLAILVLRLLRGRKGSVSKKEPLEVRPGGRKGEIPGPEAWAERFRRAGQQGAWREALEALWWWGATRLAPPGLAPSWTTEQLLGAAGTGSLTPAYRELDELRYGRKSPSPDRVRALELRLGEALP